MNTKRNLVLATSLALITSLFMMSAMARPYGPERMAEELDLNQTQIDAITALKSEYRDGRKAQAGTQKQIKMLIDEGKVDEAADLAAKQASEKVHKRAAHRAAMKNILTAEQFEKWQSMPRKGHDHRGKRMGDGEGQRQGKMCKGGPKG